MILPTEKARQLVDRMGGFTLNDAKHSAYIACNEIIEVTKKFEYGHPILVHKEIEYWQEVKFEIEKIHI